LSSVAVRLGSKSRVVVFALVLAVLLGFVAAAAARLAVINRTRVNADSRGALTAHRMTVSDPSSGASSDNPAKPSGQRLPRGLRGGGLAVCASAHRAC